MKKIFKRALSAILTAATIVSVFAGAGSAYAAETEASYKQSLIKKGFPESYVDDLYKLHKKYPKWEFTPLDVTKKSISKGKETPYTWDYCVYMETEEEAKRSLVGKSYPQFFDYSDPKMYDTGWYKASVYAVRYYMDPRNFFDEEQIFQFLDLSFNSSVTPAAVEAACKGSFLSKDWTGAGAAKLDHPTIKTYAEYFVYVGEKVNLNPIYIAACIRNEHGNTGTDSMINGKCGDKLQYYYDNNIQTEKTDGVDRLVAAPSSGYGQRGGTQLKDAYNGYYNYFNLGSAGTGRFTVYKNGMEEAKKGTPALKNEPYWNGDASWNKHFKSIHGGAYAAAGEYMGNSQNNFYLQKFNVDADSKGNFWKQYMQNIMASESRTKSLYKAYKEGNLLNGSYEFVIPVYEGMPEEKCDNYSANQIMDTKYLSKEQSGVKIASTETLDLSKYLGQDGMKKNFSSTITWPVYNGTKGSTLNLGRLNLSKYDYALIEFSTKANFVFNDNAYDSIIGFVKDPSNPYGGEKGKPNLKSNISNGVMDGSRLFKKDGGYQYRAVAKVDLDTNYIGNVYLTAYTQKGFDYLVHNIIFVTLEGHTGTVEDKNPPVTTAPVTTAPSSTSEPEVTTPVEGEITTEVPTTGDVTTVEPEVTTTNNGEATSPSEDSTIADTVAPSEDTTVSDTTSNEKENDDSNVTTIIIIVCAVVAVAAIGAGVVIFLKKKKAA